MANGEQCWASIIKATMALLKPKKILYSIGSNRNLVAILVEYCQGNQAKLELFDPFGVFADEELLEEFGSIVCLHSVSSLGALKEQKHLDLVILDEDPNWYTVYHQLKQLDTATDGADTSFPCSFVFNTGWPFGRRDGYRDPDRIPETFRRPSLQKGLVPTEQGFSDEGGLFAEIHNSIYENDLKNGVLTAVEDFISDRQRDVGLKFYSIPIFHGMGIISAQAIVDRNEGLANLFESIVPRAPDLNLLECSEVDRIHHAVNATRLQSEIRVIQNRMKEQDVLLEDRREVQARLRREGDATKQKLMQLEDALRQVNAMKRKAADDLVKLQKERDHLAATLTGVARERDSALERISSIENELRRSEIRVETLAERLEHTEHRNEIYYGDLSVARERMELVSEQLESTRADLDRMRRSIRNRELDVQRLVRWIEQLSADMEYHFQSWSWRIGATLVGLARRISGQKVVRASSFRVSRIAKEFRAWRTKRDVTVR